MKKRLIPRKYIEKAYINNKSQDANLNLEDTTEKIDKLPKEIFQILGNVISFIENTNKIEGDNDENK